MEAARDTFAPLTSLVRLAVHSDDPAQVVAAASLRARVPIGLVGADGEPLGHAPDGAAGQRALAIARAAARNRLVGAVGWRIVPLASSGPLGFLAIGVDARSTAEAHAVLDTLPELVAEQLQRVSLLRAHRAAFVRRLVSDRRFAAEEIGREAADLGLALAPAYLPAIVAWHGSAPPRVALERVARDALDGVVERLAAPLRHRVVILYPAQAAGIELGEATERLGELVARANALAPSLPAQAIVAEATVGLAEVSREVAELDALRRLGPRAAHGTPVVRSRAYALERLLRAQLDPAAAARFVEAQLERLLARDRERHTDLAAVLEAALDFPRLEQGASRCHMHRNTFRHRLQQALDTLGTTLADPDERLALHVALKLRRLLSSARVS